MAKMCVAIAAVLAVAALLLTSVAETEYIVGGEQGWKVPPEDGTPYKTWAEDKSFKAGDVLEFNFTNKEPDVVSVTRAAFESCNPTEPLEIAETNPFKFKLKEAREYHFIGTVRRGCFAGQNLTVTVAVPEDPSPFREGRMKKTTPGKPAHSATGKTTKGGTTKKTLLGKGRKS